MESSFRRKLDEGSFFKRLEERLDFVIVAGDWAGAAIVTKEGPFLLLLRDGTVDFLWVALHDESYGLGLDSALNPNVGGRQGRGVGRDLVWRSRAGNPVNGWYFERSTGHKRISPDAGKGDWVLFWCDAEERLRMREEELRIFWEKELEEPADEEMRGRKVRVPGLSWLMEEEKGRLERWETIVGAIPSSW
ncbi:uncharacterized protein EI90DRAFT_3044329, partial [Cantharellus anzutake]|uniref:uncharacterized protein n=1 Tax=Cantharellus anzutake TaxID=1750568 RepID=UPI0019049E0C